MKRARKFLWIACGTIFLLIAIGAMFAFWPADDGRTPAERRQIAEACLSMLHSPLANEPEIKPDDPRVPEEIRALNPVSIVLAGNDAVVMCDGRPAEYHLSRRRSEPRTWILYVAGPGYFGHREILRFEHD